uniref:Uncharacterized protein n=1 Tax=uncultured marine crenarchaeote HF4000_APKG2O16 TaxID=455582 RepID=B3T722_9ARCH|nr:hypothetical protein ALOHA_HF4000APKG2O16ctg10g27 [uncultured marine crenarchaeote HF4000_APKG2O16]
MWWHPKYSSNLIMELVKIVIIYFRVLINKCILTFSTTFSRCININ